MNIALLWIIPFIFILCASAYVDVKHRRIPNVFCFSLMACGLVFHSIFSGWNGLLSSSIGFAIGFAVFLLLYLLNMMGAGDVKLMAGIGAVMGGDLIVPAIVFTILSGGAIAIAYRAAAVYRARKKQFQRTVDPSLPYGLAITLGTIITLILNYTSL